MNTRTNEVRSGRATPRRGAAKYGRRELLAHPVSLIVLEQLSVVRSQYRSPHGGTGPRPVAQRRQRHLGRQRTPVTGSPL
ncbi:hypothetical protein [Streptomyces sp. NPDC048442]|uniref:hypothetical protein n=1 Tax=Streptomyces sp. NPDC048442 TaxID=3154823 RepID=UPI00343B8C50